jgi:Family of unknown function (DUF6541)
VAVVTQPIRIYRVGAGRLASSALFLALVLAAPAALVLGRALPAHGLGLILRLTAAAACVLIVPGAIFVRALGRPHTFGVAIAASFAWSLAVLAGALALTFAFDGTITTTLWLVAGFSAASLVPALLRAPVPSEESERLTVAGVAAVATLFAGAVWWASNTVYGDALFHLGRVRKLESFHLTSLSVVDEFRHGGLHPGYAFPVWHAGLAMIAQLADVDPTVVMLHLPAILTPLAVVLAYAAGAALFRSYGAGVATAAAQVGLIGFSRAGTGSFDFLALPPTVARALIAPALLALVFSLVAGGRRRQVLSISAASIALALVHPTYAFFAAVPLAGFLLARVILAAPLWRENLRIAASLPAVLIPAGLYALWLKPIVDQTVSHRPGAVERRRALVHYGNQIDVVHGLLRLAPETISRGGAVAVAGLVAIPMAALAGTRRWAAYVLGASLAVLALVLLPWAFDALSNAVSVSQARRLAIFLPIPFAVAGAASLVGRYRLAGCLAAFGAGGLLQLVYPGEFSYFLVVGGPPWPVWLALAGAGIGLIVAAIVRRSAPEAAPLWTAAVALSLVAPVGLAGLAYVKRDPPDRLRLTPGLIHALRTTVPARDTVFSDLETSYRIEAYAPVYVSAAPPAHVADTKDNDPNGRRDDVIKFLNSGSVSIPRRYHAQWIVIAKRRFDLPLDLPKAYSDSRFVLYRLSPRS